MKKMGLVALICLCSIASAKTASLNKAENQLAQALIANCVKGPDQGAAEFKKDDALEGAVNTFCAMRAILPGNQLTEAAKKFVLEGQANLAEVNLMKAQCFYNTIDGNTVNSPRELKGVDLEKVIDAVNASYADSIPADNVCANPTMCGSGDDAKAARATCKTRIELDALYRTADRFRTAEYPSKADEPAREKAVFAMKSMAEETAVSLIQARGHLPAGKY